jgi:ATP-dependent exoDNAse (exonuclease V) beta subunit
VSELLNYVRLARDVDMREGEARTLAEGSVQIMSIHQAKGLEFPVVVLGDLAYRSGHRSSYYLLDGSTLALQHKSEDGKESPSLFTLAADEAADKDAAEEARLLYVAATRARERLILSGNAGWKDGRPRLDGWWKRLAAPLGFDDAIWPTLDEEGSNSHHFELALDDQPVVCTVYEPKWQSTASLPPAPAMAAVSLPTLVGPLPASPAPDDRQAAIDRDPPERVWRIVPPGEGTSAPQWVVGKLVHAAIAQWRFEGLDDWLQAKARGLGVTDARELKGGVSRAKMVLRRFRQHPLWAEIGTADIRQHETPYSWQDGNRIEQGVIDVLYRRQGLWKLADFKTDRLRDLDDLAPEDRFDYVNQVRNYLRATSVLLGATPTAYLCFLDVAGAIVLEPVSLTGNGDA